MSKTRKLTCVVCPVGCELAVKISDSQVISVSGNGCGRGSRYAEEEITAPVRTVTTTVRLKGAQHPVCPVRTAGRIPKGKVKELIALINTKELKAPVMTGDIVIKDVFDSGVAVVVSRSMAEIKS